MKITKFAHSCLLVEVDGVRLLTDLGSWNSVPDVSELDAVLITHEHQDHFDLDKLKALLAKNPQAVVITHPDVGAKLTEAGIVFTPIEPSGRVEIKGVSIESYGTEHAIIYGDVSPCRNTGYLIAEKLFMPGDAVKDVPPKPVEILALPTGGPWFKVSESVQYAKLVHPNVVFPIHDAMYTDAYARSSVPRWFTTYLTPDGIQFVDLANGETKEF